MSMKIMNRKTRMNIAGLLFVMPWFIGSICFFIVPVIQSFVFSITKLEIKEKVYYHYVGFDNYKYALTQDAEFVKAIGNNLGTMLLNVTLVMIFSIFIAIILNQKFKGRLLARTIFFLPVIIASGVVINIIRGDIYAQSNIQGQIQGIQFQVEVLQNILHSFKLDPSTTQRIMNIINSLFEISWRCGIQILVFMAGLQTIPPQVREAANIEGATGWEYFWKITLPMISPIIQINLIFTIVDSFTDYSNPMIQRIYKLTSELDFAYSSTLTWIYFGLVFVIVGFIFAIVNRKTFYYVD